MFPQVFTWEAQRRNPRPLRAILTNPSTNSVNPNLMASVRPPRVTSAPRTLQPESAAKLSEAERAVFGNRKFYSVTLNMPNLNSAGGSWVVRFAELNHESNDHGSHDSNTRTHAAENSLSPPPRVKSIRHILCN